MKWKTHYVLNCHQMSMLHEFVYIQEVSVSNNETLRQGKNVSTFWLRCPWYTNSSKFKKCLYRTMRSSGKGTMCPYSDSNVYVTWILLNSRSIYVEQWGARAREQCSHMPSRTHSQQVCICLPYRLQIRFLFIHNVLSFSL